MDKKMDMSPEQEPVLTDNTICSGTTKLVLPSWL